jgi:hypothetical protein
LRNTKTTNDDSAHSLSKDEQFEGALTSPKIPLILTIPRSKEENEEYNSLNTNFSNRINEIEESAMASSAIAKDDKVVDIEDEDLNENKKRVVKIRGVETTQIEYKPIYMFLFLRNTLQKFL